MRTLRFIVDKQRMRKDPKCDFGSIVAGSIGYLEAEFKVSSDWANCAMIAYFTGMTEDEAEYEPVTNGKCKIPSNVLTGKAFTVQLIGTIGEDYKLVSTREIIMQKMR